MYNSCTSKVYLKKKKNYKMSVIICTKSDTLKDNETDNNFFKKIKD